jgi:hypothetical protein
MAKQRTTDHTDNVMAHLSDLADLRDEGAFVSALQEVDWRTRPAKDVVKAVQLALAAGAHMAARHLAQEGAERYPAHAELQKYARLLAPPRVIQRNLPPRPDLRTNHDWMKRQGPAYRGQWVALRDGQLLATADTFDALAQKVSDRQHVLLTRIF